MLWWQRFAGIFVILSGFNWRIKKSSIFAAVTNRGALSARAD